MSVQVDFNDIEPIASHDELDVTHRQAQHASSVLNSITSADPEAQREFYNEQNRKTITERKRKEKSLRRKHSLLRKTRERFHNRWPTALGIGEVISGFIISLLGLVEVFIIPIAEDIKSVPQKSCYGIGLWTGPLLVITGSVAIRSSISKRSSTVYRFYLLTVITLLVYLGGIILLIVGYSEHWTPIEPEEGVSKTSFYTIHTIMSVAIFIGALFAFVAVIQYFDDVFFGDLELGTRLLNCFAPCCPRVSHGKAPPQQIPTVNEKILPNVCATTPSSNRGTTASNLYS